jgi:hypothetical protein
MASRLEALLASDGITRAAGAGRGDGVVAPPGDEAEFAIVCFLSGIPAEEGEDAACAVEPVVSRCAGSASPADDAELLVPGAKCSGLLAPGAKEGAAWPAVGVAVSVLVSVRALLAACSVGGNMGSATTAAMVTAPTAKAPTPMVASPARRIRRE